MHTELESRLDREALASGIDTPALTVDLGVLEANLAEMRAICDRSGVELLPHAKTHRVPEIGLLQISSGADGLCVATVAEAQTFAAAGIRRLIIAYPLTGDAKVQRAHELAATVDLTLATDSVLGARRIGERFASSGQSAQLYLIVDSGLGRVGVAPEDAAETAQSIAALPGVELTGIMTHEGTVYEATDPADRDARAVSAAELMVSAATSIRARGVRLQHVSMGASASARVVAGVTGVTQIRPGIFAFNDLGQMALGNATVDTCAVRVLSTVVSHPDPRRACVDAGSKALGQDLLPGAALRQQFPGHGMLVGLEGWRIERLSEEHGWLRWHGPGDPSPLEIGQRVTIIPNHVCTAFFCHGAVHALRGGTVVDRWATMHNGDLR